MDRCAGQLLADWLRDQGHDVKETRETNPDPGDEAILQWAVQEDRILITTDKDFGEILFLHNQPHAGIVRLPQIPHVQRIELMRRVIELHAEALDQRALVTVRGRRIRITRYP